MSTRLGSKRTLARSVARLTAAASTPGSLARDFSTRRTQEAQVMPPMGSWTSVVSAVVSTGAAGSWIIVIVVPSSRPG